MWNSGEDFAKEANATSRLAALSLFSLCSSVRARSYVLVPFFLPLFLSAKRVKGKHPLFQRAALISSETNDQAHKDSGKNRWLPSLKLIYVTIIFNNAKRARSNLHWVLGVASAVVANGSVAFISFTGALNES